jgi:RHS repeat-associated protein
VVDNAGVVQNHVVYDAFGGVTSQSNSSVVFRYGYTARELDAESGLQYNRARYLDSFNGRFISEDPIGFQGQDANLYRYVGNSPSNYTDPSGEVTAYDVLNAADQFSGSFSRVVTFGATDIVRENIYGDDVNKNQTGTFANLGTGAGVVTSVLFGAAAPRALVGITNLQRLAQAHTVTGAGLGAYQSTTNIINGCATPWDALAFTPLLKSLRGNPTKLGSNTSKGGDDLRSLFTTSSKSTAPSVTYSIYDVNKNLLKNGVSDGKLIRYQQSLGEAGKGATGTYSSVVPKFQAHINEKYLNSLFYNTTGKLPRGNKYPYPIDFNTGKRIKP